MTAGGGSDGAAERWLYAADYDDPLLAHLYDLCETGVEDVGLLRRLIAAWRPAGAAPLRILEPFCGTGRLLLPLLADGHRVTGIEMARAMVARAIAKAAALGEEARRRAEWRVGDALTVEWGSGYDLVILGGNCLYELPDARSQERCIALAAGALAPGGRLFVDNDDYRGGWGQDSYPTSRVTMEGTDPVGVYGRATATWLGFDDATQVLAIRREWLVRTPEGVESRREYLASKRPVSAADVRRWLAAHGLRVVAVYGDRRGAPHAPGSPRAISWAEKPREG